MKMIPHLRPLLLACLAAFSPIQAQQPAAAASEPSPEEQAKEEKEFLAKVESWGWLREGSGKIGDKAEIVIPPGYRFTGNSGAGKMMEALGNPPSTHHLAMLASEDLKDHYIIFSFDDSGYIKDDEKNDLDADALFENLKEQQAEGNKRRKEMGLSELELTGWAVPPRYNDRTKNLEWAIRYRSIPDGNIGVNHDTRILGRKGNMKIRLLCSAEELEALLPSYQKIVDGFSYIQGERYAEYQSGDKIAEYGLTALVAGGGAYALAKSGLFAKLGIYIAKLGKAAILLVVGVLVAIKKLFSKLFGFRQSE